ncbi:MAG: RNA methyltransferase [Bacteroidales bacterium]|nr:RNA methyltransferase [Bacteroidales bacterium]
MLSKNGIKLIKSLSQKKFRDQEGLFTVEGEKMVAEALASDFEVVSVYRTSEIGEEAMSRITALSSPSPALAVVRIPAPEAFVPTAGELVLALDSLRDPGNLGTIIRLADWFGIRTVLASRDTVDIYNPKVVQATMGAIFRVRFIYCDLPETLSLCRAAGLPVYGTFLDGENIYGSALSADGVIVMGSESNGISPAVEALVDRRLYIPPYPASGTGSESLNVAIATAITCSEFRRR